MKRNIILVILGIIILILALIGGYKLLKQDKEKPSSKSSIISTDKISKKIILDDIWPDIEGYWNGEEDYFLNFYEEYGTKNVLVAIWYSEPNPPGTITEFEEIEKNKYKLKLYLSPTEEFPDGEELYIELDLNQIKDKRLLIKTNTIDESFTFVGKTLEEALSIIK